LYIQEIFAGTCLELEYVERCGTAGQGTGGNIMGRMRFASRVNKAQIHKHVVYNVYIL